MQRTQSAQVCTSCILMQVNVAHALLDFTTNARKCIKYKFFFALPLIDPATPPPRGRLDDFPQKNPTFWQKKKVKTTTWQEEDIMEQTCVWAVLVGGEYFHSVQSGDLGKSK